jgi:glycosyltransferase involved in cell wall biosynthesis
MVTTFYPPFSFGGDGMYVRRLCHALASRGHSVDVIHDIDAYRVGGGQAREPLAEPPGIRVHGLRSRSSLLSTLATQQLGRPLVHGATIRRLLGEGFDVIHFHNVSLVGGPGVLEYGSGVKLYTAHEHWLVCPTHILWRFNREPCDGRQCVKCMLMARRPPQLWRSGELIDRQAKHIDAFLALSEFSARKHAEFGFRPPMTVFPSFLPDLDPLPAEQRSGPPYFLFVGRLEAIKGLDDAIPHFDDDMPAELWIAGQGAEEPKLRELAKGSPKVRFLGQRPSDELRTLYRNAIALLTPSRCFEVFPLVVLEAFREGTPVIARSLGPFPEIVDQTGAGLLFSSPAELREALLRLSGDAALRADLGTRAAAAFEARWSERVVMEAYFALITRIARERGLQRTLQALDMSASLHHSPAP